MPRGVNPVDEALIQGQLWTPPQLNNLAVWLDASDFVGVADGTAISEIRNKGYANNASQSDSTKRPVVKAGIQSGLPGVRFDGTNDCLTIASLTLNTTLSIFLVAKTTNAKPFFVEFGNAGVYFYGTDLYAYQIATPGGNNQGQLPTNWFGSSVGQAALVTKEITSSGKMGSVFKNGTQQELVSGGTSGFGANTAYTDTLNIFARNNGASVQSDGDLHEFIIYNNVTADEVSRQKVEGYLAWKWGLRQQLTAGHPYINRPPTIGG